MPSWYYQITYRQMFINLRVGSLDNVITGLALMCLLFRCLTTKQKRHHRESCYNVAIFLKLSQYIKFIKHTYNSPSKSPKMTHSSISLANTVHLWIWNFLCSFVNFFRYSPLFYFLQYHLILSIWKWVLPFIYRRNKCWKMTCGYSAFRGLNKNTVSLMYHEKRSDIIVDNFDEIW